MNEFKIRYKIWYALILTFAGFFQFYCYYLSTLYDNEATASFVLGLFFIILAIAFAVTPIVVFTETEVLVKNLFGMIRKRYLYADGEISFEGASIFANYQKIISGFLIRYDKEKLVEFLKEYSGKSDY